MEDADLLEQLDGHLGSPNISWLLGAGISFQANVPLMYPLTGRVIQILKESKNPSLKIVEDLQKEIDEKCHVEHILSHLGDYAALVDRTKSGSVTIGTKSVKRAEIDAAHVELVKAIAETVRWGYSPADSGNNKEERIGQQGKCITDVSHHCSFITACFQTARAGLNDRRAAVKFFTTNYDTLLEDALALSRVRYWDGFDGGALAYRSYRLGDGDVPMNFPAHVIKLHGSIDWHINSNDGRVYRVRYGDSYPDANQRVLIYPQSTKYLAAQRDPFSAQFDLFRKALTAHVDSTIAVCGYSFGDDHINQEMEIALGRADSKTTLVAFCFETEAGLPECLDRWRGSAWGSRVYVATNKGLYVGASAAQFCQPARELAWWTFSGVTQILKNGAGSAVG